MQRFCDRKNLPTALYGSVGHIARAEDWRCVNMIIDRCDAQSVLISRILLYLHISFIHRLIPSVLTLDIHCSINAYSRRTTRTIDDDWIFALSHNVIFIERHITTQHVPNIEVLCLMQFVESTKNMNINIVQYNILQMIYISLKYYLSLSRIRSPSHTLSLFHFHIVLSVQPKTLKWTYFNFPIHKYISHEVSHGQKKNFDNTLIFSRFS